MQAVATVYIADYLLLATIGSTYSTKMRSVDWILITSLAAIQHSIQFLVEYVVCEYSMP